MTDGEEMQLRRKGSMGALSPLGVSPQPHRSRSLSSSPGRPHTPLGPSTPYGGAQLSRPNTAMSSFSQLNTVSPGSTRPNTAAGDAELHQVRPFAALLRLFESWFEKTLLRESAPRGAVAAKLHQSEPA
jgi:hypothetical protein